MRDVINRKRNEAKQTIIETAKEEEVFTQYHLTIGYRHSTLVRLYFEVQLLAQRDAVWIGPELHLSSVHTGLGTDFSQAKHLVLEGVFYNFAEKL